MLLQIPKVLDASQVAHCRQALERAEWVDGRATAGHQSERVKNNMQVPEGHPVARELGDMILAALERNALFITAALPLKVYPPLFNRYQGGETYGTHIDGAIREVMRSHYRVRTDLSATLFLTPPEEYDGGELMIEDTYDARRARLVVLLAAKHGPQQRAPDDAARSRYRDPAAQPHRAGRARARSADGALSQSSSPVVRHMSIAWRATVLRRLHLLLGGLLSIPLAIIGLTGSVLMFEPQLQPGHDFVRASAGPAQSYAAMVDAARTAAPKDFAANTIFAPVAAGDLAMLRFSDPRHPGPGGV